MLLGRWTDGGPGAAALFEGWVGAITRKGKTRTRTVVVPRELQGTDLEIFIYRVGDPARRLGTAGGEPLDLRAVATRRLLGPRVYAHRVLRDRRHPDAVNG